MKKDRVAVNWIWMIMIFLIAVLSMMAVLRSFIIGLDIDEQYAVTLAYRVASGDILIKQMWEPHQTSALLPALFVKLFLLLKRDTTYLLLFMRISGVAFQFFLSITWFVVIRKDYGEKPALLSALMVFHTLPKWIATIEFANQQIWFVLLIVLCLLSYEKNGKKRDCILAGLAMVFEALAYPSAVLLFIPYFIWIFHKNKKDAFWFSGVCILAAFGFIGYLLCHMSWGEIFANVGYILADGEHSIGLGMKAATYGRELLEVFFRIAVYALLALCVVRIFKIRHFWVTTILIAILDQVRLWAFGLAPTVHPQLHYLLMFLWAANVQKMPSYPDLSTTVPQSVK